MSKVLIIWAVTLHAMVPWVGGDQMSGEAHSGSAPAERLETVIVRNVLSQRDILATLKSLNSVHAVGLSFRKTPRNVAVTSPEQLGAIDTNKPRDVVKLTGSSYIGANFWARTQANIRGQVGEVYINGVCKDLMGNSNGVPINVNALESVNTVKGAGNAILGKGWCTNLDGVVADMPFKMEGIAKM